MTDDLLARIDAALDPLCPKCGHQTTEEALTLYGHCFTHGMAVEYAPADPLPESIARAGEIAELERRLWAAPTVTASLGFRARPDSCACDREPDTNASIPNDECALHGIGLATPPFIYGQSATTEQIVADDDAWRWRVRNRFAALSARPESVLSGVTGDSAPPHQQAPCDCPDAAVGFDGTWESGVAIHCRAHGYRLLPDPPEPKHSPSKPLSTWQKIIRWCQRRLARTRERR